ncbi:Type III restriction-modification system methylation subunit [hydrothermal vent metagenome]|uniref:Type III restriction-modification system methylation subunit n=1 Tax=hydrothermal vent metagenome TaxID=652676 RepID=A0A3B0UZB5_9ZZZZ
MPKKNKDTVRLEWSSRERARPGEGPDLLYLYKKELVLPLPAASSSRPGPHAPAVPPATGRLIRGDNLCAVEALLREGPGKNAELIYIDPPFLSKADYTHKITIQGHTINRRAYGDRWSREGYLDMLAPRLALMRELLTDTGKLFVHCDWRASGLIRILLDEVFGHGNFINEIVWHYGGRGAKATSGQFARNHDTILVYGRSPKARLNKIYTERLLSEKEARANGIRKDPDGRYFKTAPRGDYTDESIRRLEKEGRIHRTRSGKVRIKYFLEARGDKVVEQRPVGDVWIDIPDAMHSPLKERTDYGTQKPVALLKRIIESATVAGDLVCDLFGGSGTTAVAAASLGRRWISVEAGGAGTQVAKNRLAEIIKNPFTVEGLKDDTDKAAASTPSPIAPEEARLIIGPPLIKKNQDKSYAVELTLKGYEPGKKSSEDLPGKLLKAPLSLIDSWAIDWDYDAVLFRSMWRSSRGAGKDAGEVELKACATLKKKPSRICVRAVDIMGVEKEMEVGV